VSDFLLSLVVAEAYWSADRGVSLSDLDPLRLPAALAGWTLIREASPTTGAIYANAEMIVEAHLGDTSASLRVASRSWDESGNAAVDALHRRSRWLVP
jgi:hypothetical protein